MLLQIPDVLVVAQVADARRRLASAPWVDGGGNAGHPPPHPRLNQQVPEGHPVARDLGDLIVTELQRSPLFMSAALPLRVFPPVISRYTGGELSGHHVETAIRQVSGAPERLRTDLSATLFLADPDEYEGGELVLEDTYGVHTVKLPAGHMALYPASSIHQVRPVTRGARLAASFWVQSMIRDDGERTLLFDLDTAIQRLTVDMPHHAAAAQLMAVYHNLLRRWAHV